MLKNRIANILVVDDEPELLRQIACELSAPSVKIHTAGNIDEAIALAEKSPPDVLITDLLLGENNGIEVIDRLRKAAGGRIPAVIITTAGQFSLPTFISDAGGEPLEILAKPLNIDKLKATINTKLIQQADSAKLHQRILHLRDMIRDVGLDREKIRRQFERLHSTLKSACRAFSMQMSLQQEVIRYQCELIELENDDEIFRSLFQSFAHWSGTIFGIALGRPENDQLKMLGRFGIPRPDSLAFCQKLVGPIVDLVLVKPECCIIDVGAQMDIFDEKIRRFLPGITAMAIPLMPCDDELVAMAVLYRKGEQPFSEDDLSLANSIMYPTALALNRNSQQ